MRNESISILNATVENLSFVNPEPAAHHFPHVPIAGRLR